MKRLTIFTAILTTLYAGHSSAAYRYSDLDNLGQRINDEVRASLAHLDNLGSRISNSVRKQTSGLENLGAQIEQSVYQSLEPVRALEVIAKMKDGIGGVTLIMFGNDNSKIVLVKNRIQYECTGDVSWSTGECSGNLIPLQFKSDRDFCYTKQRISINNKVCLAPGSVSVQVNNNNFVCKGVDNDVPVLIIDMNGLKKLCKDLLSESTYKYFADFSNPQRIEIPNPNKSIKCKNNQPGICEFTEYNNYDGNVNYFSSIYVS